MNIGLRLDTLLWLVIATGLTLLFVPQSFLLEPKQSAWLAGIAVVGCGVAYWVKHQGIAKFFAYGAIFVLCLADFHYQAEQLLQQAHAVEGLEKRIEREIRIVEVLHQQDYQTLIATAQLDETLPEQRLYVQWQRAEKVAVGQRWRAELSLRPLSSRLNEGGFDRQKWYFSKGITAYARVKSAVKISEDFSWREARLQTAFQHTQALSMQGLLLALGFGERAWLKPTHWQIYQKTNTAHLIAISGLHIGLAMLLGVGIARGIQFCLPTYWITPMFPLFIGAIIALIYAYLAGFSIPTLRALVALGLVCLVRGLRFYHTPWQYFQRVVAVLIFCQPLMVLSVSFWLSVGAVASLILWYQYVPLDLFQPRIDLVRQDRPFSLGAIIGKLILRWCVALLHLQLGLLLVFTPVQLYFFHGFSLAGMIANVFAVPLFSFFLVPLVLFAVLSNGAFSSWQGANELAEKITIFLSNWQHKWIDLSQTQSQWIGLGLCALGLSYVFGLWQVQKNHSLNRQKSIPFIQDRTLAKWKWRLNPDKIPSPLCLKKLGIVLCVIFLINSGNLLIKHFRQPDWRLETLDVGQGLATLIVKEQRGILYDTGAAWQNGSMAELEILPYLRRQGIVLDYLILSHDDNDHAGGAEAVLRAYPNATLITSSEKIERKTHRTFCFAGTQWQWQGLQISALSPQKVVKRAENNDSCVLLIDDGRHKVLLTGDAESQIEPQFIYKAGKVDVLQVGHHGSKTSTSEALVKTLQPSIALISSGRGNPWHFPHYAVLARLQAQQSAVLNTADFGQIRLSFSAKKPPPENISIDTARGTFSPWYRELL